MRRGGGRVWPIWMACKFGAGRNEIYNLIKQTLVSCENTAIREPTGCDRRSAESL